MILFLFGSIKFFFGLISMFDLNLKCFIDNLNILFVTQLFDLDV